MTAVDIKTSKQPKLESVGSMSSAIGRVVAVSGSQIVLKLANQSKNDDGTASSKVEMGSLITIPKNDSCVIGMVSALTIPAPIDAAEVGDIMIGEVELLGESTIDPGEGQSVFKKGISSFPGLGDNAYLAGRSDLETIFSSLGESLFQIGTVYQDSTLPAYVLTDQLIKQHIAVLGATGTGKSCAMTLVLQGILENHTDSRIVLLDPHNEYGESFGDKAEVISPESLHLPYWLMNFEELVEVVLGGDQNAREEAEILSELIPLAKATYQRASEAESAGTPLVRKVKAADRNTTNTPKPYRMADLIAMIDQEMGKLDQRSNTAPYRKLKSRLELLSADSRYAFMFGSLTVTDTMSDVLSRIFRIPTEGKPISLLDLSAVPHEILNVVVSVLCRLAFDLAHWSDGAFPITFVCEEAHRYAPRDSAKGFDPTRRALSRIAREGRKYGVSLAIVSQRPMEIDPAILSQCSTFFAFRLTNENDQELIRAATSDAGVSLLEMLPSMSNGEAVAFGAGVTLPSRVTFSRIDGDIIPGKKGATGFPTDSGQDEQEFLGDVIERWRAQRRN